jgi:hypothetical protein
MNFATYEDYRLFLAEKEEIIKLLRQSEKFILFNNAKMPPYWEDSQGHQNQLDFLLKLRSKIDNLERNTLNNKNK